MQQYRYKKRTIMPIIVGAVISLALGTAGYFAKSYYDLRANSNKTTEGETKQLMDAVGQLYQLPVDETPIVGKIQDKDKLKDQPFFKNAHKNDDILIYQKAKVAIIYRVSENKLINVGPIAIDAASKQEPTAPQ